MSGYRSTAIYPSGKFEVVFQWMQYRPSFEVVLLVDEQGHQRLPKGAGLVPRSGHVRPQCDLRGRRTSAESRTVEQYAAERHLSMLQDGPFANGRETQFCQGSCAV